MTWDERKNLDELTLPGSSNELKNIISHINAENPCCNTLFKGKYQVLLLENFFPYQKPIGEVFQITLAVCGAKRKIFSEANDETISELYSPDEVDGSPLPVIFDSYIDEKATASSSSVKHLKEKYILYPLSKNIGRKILWLYKTITDKEKVKFPFIALCYGRNHKATSLLGLSRQEKFTRISTVTQGTISKQEQLPILSCVKLDHLSGFATSCASVEISVFAHYDILRSDMSDLQPCKDMNVVVECYWSNATSILEPIPSDCSCVAKIKAVDGDDKTGVFSKYKEINLIMVLHKGLQTNVIEWPEKNASVNLMKNIEDFLKDQKAAILKKEKMMPVVAKFENFDHAVKDNPSNLDFTDKLWLVLKDCPSVEELRDAFIYVYDELSRFVLPPYVCRKNMSTIAVAIKNMREKPIMCPIIDFHLALKLALEIGIEKLRKDYVMLFVGLELAPYDYLKYFMEPEIISLEAVTCLRKLHTVLELSVICLKCLQFPKQLLSEFVRNTLKHYMSVTDLDLQHVFNFEFPSARARHFLNQMRPTTWEISLLSSQKDYLKQTVLHFSTTPTPEHIYAPNDYPARLMLQKASYVFTRTTLVQDKFI